MKTPTGIECRYFYGNYFRGKNQEECRLFEGSPALQQWTSALCKSCPVPGIIRANACKNMVLKPDIDNGVLGFKKRVKITAYCSLSNQTVKEPEIGCGKCHPLPPFFEGKSS
jgi:hypothetical protein